MPARLLRLPAVAVALAALALAGCGSKEDAYKEADTEGVYVAAGGLTWQIQLSRAMNPALVEDQAWFRGLPGDETRPTGSQEWFGIWLRAQNQTSRALRSTSGFYIEDTQLNRYYPVPLSASNDLAYRAQILPAHATIPNENSIAYLSDAQGELLLFKLPVSVYQNRPIVLHWLSADGSGKTVATAQIDL
jgi:hypothetical protein